MPVAWIFLIVLGGCTEATPTPRACSSCHGTPASAAPPVALGGLDDSPAIGAHTAHEVPSGAVAVACSECHEVPTTVDAPGHIDTPVPAEVQWGTLGAQGVAEPYDVATQSCTVYCHGSTFVEDAAVQWNDGAGAVACGRCHGLPPPPPHPADAQCSNCHPAPGEGAHIDGQVSFGSGAR